ncbi:hypothetical protein [uncultured Erythrobacter sp.]|uniref:hypothetical protein n=1 Tax=uncultured Erythrobacter sp. TaxID=263913 RepID=UPI002632B0A3|nr:hypothetical protein [uncultured Erythrobacter sp.]
MIKLSLIALAMAAFAPEHSIDWNDDGSLQIMLTFAPENAMDPFDEGENLLDDIAEQTCSAADSDKKDADMIDEVRVRGIAISPEGERLITISATYVCK